MRAKGLPKILIIYTGGTFGMSRDQSRKGNHLRVPKLSPEGLRRDFADRVPELSEIARCEIDVLMNCDSAHIGPAEWVQMASHIRKKWKQFDGVVVLHGTDTLPYTASALSFLLRPCIRPVVITGAQRPLALLRSDARRNLVSAVEIAAGGPRPLLNGVSVFFDDKLFQGNKVQKKSAVDYHAFESPYAEPLAVVGTEIRYRSDGRARRIQRTPLLPRFSPEVAIIHLTPGFPARSFAEGWLPHLKGMVINVFPSGTAPTHDPDFVEMLRKAKKLGVPVVVVTEGGCNNPVTYEAGEKLLVEGCIWAGGMTTECSFVKTALLLGQPSVQKKGIMEFKRLWNSEMI